MILVVTNFAISIHIWLVVFRHPSEKYEFVNWDDDIPNINGTIKFMATSYHQSVSSYPTRCPFSFRFTTVSPGADAALRHVRGDGDGREAGRDLGQLHRHLGVEWIPWFPWWMDGAVMICK